MNYYKRHWDETTGDELTNEWGTSDYYFETDDELYVLRQIQVFQNGHALKYDTDYFDDSFGGLSEVALDFEDFEPYRIYKTEFEQLWTTLPACNQFPR